MSDFPTSLIDFQRRFPDEAACAAYLFESDGLPVFAVRPAIIPRAGRMAASPSPMNAPPAASRPPSRRERSCMAPSCR